MYLDRSNLNLQNTLLIDIDKQNGFQGLVFQWKLKRKLFCPCTETCPVHWEHAYIPRDILYIIIAHLKEQKWTNNKWNQWRIRHFVLILFPKWYKVKQHAFLQHIAQTKDKLQKHFC